MWITLRRRVASDLKSIIMAKKCGVLSTQSIGDLLGLSIETISRQLQGLARAGLIALPSRRTIELVDRAALERLVGARRSTIEGVRV